MDVNQAVAPSLDKIGVEQPHKPGKADEFDPLGPQPRIGLCSKLAAVAMRDDGGRDIGCNRTHQTRRISPIAYHHPNLGRVAGVGASLDQRLQIRSTSRYQHSQAHRHLPVSFGPLTPSAAGVTMASSAKLRYDRDYRACAENM